MLNIITVIIFVLIILFLINKNRTETFDFVGKYPNYYAGGTDIINRKIDHTNRFALHDYIWSGNSYPWYRDPYSIHLWYNTLKKQKWWNIFHRRKFLNLDNYMHVPYYL